MASTHSLDLESTSSQYASISDASQTGLDVTGDLSIEAWVMLESSPSTGVDFMIVSKRSTAGYALRINNTSGTERIYLDIDTVANGLDSFGFATTGLATGEWYHIVGTFTASSSTGKIYLNGVEQSSSAGVNTSIDNTADAFTVGAASGGGSGYFDGLVKEVRVWNDVRTATEIAQNAGKELVGTETNLQGYWRFNNDYTDTTSNSNDLTSSGSPVFSTTIPFSNPVDVSSSTVLTTNLVSFWDLEESSGTRVDSHGSNDLTDNNTVLQGTGINGNCADFERTNTEYLSIADASQTGLDITGDLSMSVWVNIESAVTGQVYSIMAKGTSSTDNSYYFLYRDQDSVPQIQFKIDADGNNPIGGNADFTKTLSTATWHHLVVTYDSSAGKVRLYIDGVEHADSPTISMPTSIHNSAQPFWIGSGADGGGAGSGTFDGLMDSAGIWSKVLSYGDVLDLYNEGSGIAYSSGVTVDITETVTTTENVSALRARIANITESVTTSEIVSAVKTIVINIVESISLSEVVSTVESIIEIITNISKTLASNILGIGKNSASTTNTSKNTATTTGVTKNSASVTNTTKNTSSVTNQSRS